jgi:hypothetical protein
MSLTSQLKQKNSPVRQFFEKYENKAGMAWCIALNMQSTKQIIPMKYEPELQTAYSFMGTTIDYLLRYTLQGNRLSFEDSFAYKTIKSRPFILVEEAQRIIKPEYFHTLFEIGKFYLDGRDAVDEQSAYSALALAVLEHYYRSGFLPKMLTSPISSEEDFQINNLDGKSLTSKTAWFFFDKLYQSLGGKLYAYEVSELVRLFARSLHDPNSELYRAAIREGSQSLVNSKLVGGADFDCVIDCNSRSVLTDIKTTLEPVSITNFRQLLGYALLCDPDKDGFDFSDIGFYHSRSASFRFLPIERVIKECLPSLNSIKYARAAFISELGKSQY